MRLTRRGALAAAAGLAALGCQPKSQPRQTQEPAMTTRMPVVYLPHGGGPWPFVEIGMDKAEDQALRAHLEALGRGPKPKALLVVSAHWEERVPTVMSGSAPPLLYDYSGFPEAAYALQWPAPGDPKLAAQTRALLEHAGFETASDDKRGFDHGTFVPLKLAFPQADIPTIQLSLQRGLDPETHLRMGRAIAPLRDEGVLIVGSGMSFHNMRAFFSGGGEALSLPFDRWLNAAVTGAPEERDAALLKWVEAPGARGAHPREEHLLPLMVIAGAAGTDPGKLAFSGTVFGAKISGHVFG